MTKFRNAAVTFLPFALLTACAAGSGEWPSLAKRPGEAAVAAGPAAGAGDSAVAAPAAVIAGRVQDASRDLDRLAERLTAQTATTSAAARAARGSGAASELAATAQLELSRLERIGAQLSDLRDRLDALAGDAAVAAAQTGLAPAELAAIGRLIQRTEALHAGFAAAFEAARASTPR